MTPVISPYFLWVRQCTCSMEAKIKLENVAQHNYMLLAIFTTFKCNFIITGSENGTIFHFTDEAI